MGSVSRNNRSRFDRFLTLKNGPFIPAEHLTDKMLDDVMAQYRPITVRITHSEQSSVTALDFMVEKLTATPLSDVQRSELSGQCKQVMEESTKRGFRVKLII